MKEIHLTDGTPVLVDDEDYEWLSQYTWHPTGGKKNGGTRAQRYDRDTRKQVSMYRQIMGAPAGVCVDHINHNPQDNRRCNLRDSRRFSRIDETLQ